MTVIKRNFLCTGCGVGRECKLEVNQEPSSDPAGDLDALECVLDSTNQTSYNWIEVFKGKTPIIDHMLTATDMKVLRGYIDDSEYLSGFEGMHKNLCKLGYLNGDLELTPLGKIYLLENF